MYAQTSESGCKIYPKFVIKAHASASVLGFESSWMDATKIFTNLIWAGWGVLVLCRAVVEV
jgi:hypothetical protein